MKVFYTLNINDITLKDYQGVESIELFHANHPNVHRTISNFNSLYNWDEMFTVDDVKTRLESGERLFLFYNLGKLVGHVWFSTKEHQKPSIYSYNIFIDKRLHNKESFDSTIYFSKCVEKLKKEGYEKIHVYVDEWNNASHQFCERMGFVKD
jgi:RimJ/RimL family protein N-acetyltransferase